MASGLPFPTQRIDSAPASELVDKLKAENSVLRKALTDLVGSDSREELEGMETVMRAMPMPESERSKYVGCIRALLDTMPGS